VSGLAAFLLGLSAIAFSLLLFPEQMMPNLLSEAAGVLLEISLVILIVDRLGTRQRRRDWAFAHRAVSQRMAAAMVDVVRLLSVKANDSAYAANKDRISEFVEMGRLHLDDLGNNITALASFAEPDQYEKARIIELNLSWLLRMLSRSLSLATRTGAREMSAAQRSTGLIMDFFRLDQTGIQTIDEIQTLLARETGGDGPEPMLHEGDTAGLFQQRMRLQTLIGQTYQHDLNPGIIMDAQNELAVHYFTIDWWLLSKFRVQVDAR